MKLSNTLLSEFAEIISNNNKKSRSETITYGTIEKENETMYVKIDGSDIKTPVIAAADTKAGDRVIVMVKHHTAIVTGNLSSPAARIGDVSQAITDSATAIEKVRTFEDDIDDMIQTVETHSNDIENLQKNVLAITDINARQDEDITKLKSDVSNIQGGGGNSLSIVVGPDKPSMACLWFDTEP